MKKIAIGVDVGGTNLRGALIDSGGSVIERKSVLSGAGNGVDFMVDNLTGLINELREGEDIAGVGVGIPGIIDAERGILTQAPNISNVNDYPFREAFTDKIRGDVPFFLENDANCAALGEWWVGAGQGVVSLVAITLGTGVGGGIILGGELWRGADGMGGEVGHITIYPDGAKCNCGNFGCLESYSSANGIRRMVRERLRDENLETVLRGKISDVAGQEIPEIVMESASEGDAFSLLIWEEVGKALGIAIADLVNVLNVEMVVIGGGISNAWGLFINTALGQAKQRGLRAPMERVQVVRSDLGDDAGLIGAGYLVFKGS